MSKYITGFCGNGFCEGTKPKSPSGKPIKVCSFVDVCNCDCHKKISSMFEMTNTERIVMQNPDYVPYDSGIMDFLATMQDISADVLDSAKKSLAEEKPVVTVDGSIMTGLARSGRNFEPTKRGRAAGQLEDEVRDICNRFLQREFPEQEICTPKFIAYKIAEESGEVKTPSVGAIGAVFDRWAKIGFATIDKNPVRFTTFTVAGLTRGLEALKEEAKANGPTRRARLSR